jgi:pectate lyase
VTLHHNRFSDLKERRRACASASAVLVNNLYEVRGRRTWPFAIRIGVGLHSRLVSEHNAWVSDGRGRRSGLLRVFKGTRFRPGLAARRPAAARPAQRGRRSRWTVDPLVRPPYALARWPSPSQVAARVRSGAGAGRLPAALATANR